jgi:NAD(P)-dependent dehydrogenase (short-subunit alcohol dehydrogenase family)
VEELEEPDWYRLLDTNLTSVYRLSKRAIPEIRRRGGGSIVNIASVAGIMAENRCPAYSASKAGEIAQAIKDVQEAASRCARERQPPLLCKT